MIKLWLELNKKWPIRYNHPSHMSRFVRVVSLWKVKLFRGFKVIGYTKTKNQCGAFCLLDGKAACYPIYTDCAKYFVLLPDKFHFRISKVYTICVYI